MLPPLTINSRLGFIHPGLEGPFYASYGHGMLPRRGGFRSMAVMRPMAPDVGRGFRFTHFNGRLRNFHRIILKWTLYIDMYIEMYINVYKIQIDTVSTINY